LRESDITDSFFVVLHGIAGSGKSSLAASVFADVPDLLGSYFESIVWLRDSDSEPSRLFSDLLLLLWDDATSDPPKHANVSPVYLNKHIQEALVDKPNVIVVLDDVVQQETVTWASQLGVSISIIQCVNDRGSCVWRSAKRRYFLWRPWVVGPCSD
uniref:Cell death protein 4 (inferred by orthology to a C. elegans protein) n=1 Tax=Nippostrongylus brasiliensis TaxID=27835 RepID=A0A0N4XSB0_NIPBR